MMPSLHTLHLEDDVDAKFFDQLSEGSINDTQLASVPAIPAKAMPEGKGCQEDESDDADLTHFSSGIDAEVLGLNISERDGDIACSDSGKEDISGQVCDEYLNTNADGTPGRTVEQGSIANSDAVESDKAKSTKVKEVDWSSFKSASNTTELAGFGSFSDFFSQLSEIPVEHPSDSADNSFYPRGEVDLFQYGYSPATASNDVFYHTEAVPTLNVGTVSDASYQQESGMQGQSSPTDGSFYGNQSWDQMYPGWYLNPETGLFEQTEGFNSGPASINQGTYLTQESAHAQDVFTDSKLSSTVPSDMPSIEHGQNTAQVVNNDSVDTDWWQQQSIVATESNHQQSMWEQEYPGWCYDQQSQNWYQKQETGAATEHVGVYDGSMLNKAETVLSPVGNEQSGGHGNNQHHGNGQSTGEPYSVSASYQEVLPAEGLHDLQSQSYQALPKDNISYPIQDQQWSMASNSYYPDAGFAYSQYSSNQYQQFNHPVSFTVSPPRTIQEALRSTAGRPPHTLMAFGFGGMMSVMHPHSPQGVLTTSGDQAAPGPVQLHKLQQVMSQSGVRCARNSCFGSTSTATFVGPLIGGNTTNKDLLKWIEERVSNCEYDEHDSTNPTSIRILWGLLKISCQNYGNLRSTVGKQDDNGPEAALAKLLEPSKTESSWAFKAPCLMSLPSEQQLQATSLEVKKLLIAGKRREALQQAQQGQLWGLALVLARQLGEKFYADAIADMAKRQYQPGFPLRTLTLLYAGQPAEVFVGDRSISSGMSQPIGIHAAGAAAALNSATQDGVEGMLEEWQENLAMMAANRTVGDERVIMHLGDCLWSLRGEIAAAHACYLVAEAPFEAYSSSSRMCLIGADHCKYPRTYALPEAIQRTEVYEYAKVFANPQYILVPFQPYKLLYASMLAEAGKTNEALRYSQSVLKMLKAAGHAPEVEACRQAAASLEDRLRVHAQAGHNFTGPVKLVGRLLNTLDKSIHRMFGGPTSPMEPGANPNGLSSSVSSYASTASRENIPSMVPSMSMEPICDLATKKPNAPTRSVSAPDFRNSSQPDKSPPKPQEKNGSRFGKFGVQIFQRAVGLVRPNTKEAKLGDQNKFYYDEKLKRWVEEGVPLSNEETYLAPPPITSRMNEVAEISHTPLPRMESQVPDNHLKPSNTNPNTAILGTPPMPPSSNQFSARGRHQGVRSRYVDTFNKNADVTPPRLLSTPLLPPARPGAAMPAKFFVPAEPPVAQTECLNETSASSPVDVVPANIDAVDNFGIANQNGGLYGGVRKELQFPIMPRTHSAEDTSNYASNGQMSFITGNDHDRNKTLNHMNGTNQIAGTHARAASWGGFEGFQSSNIQERNENGSQTKMEQYGRPLPSPPLLNTLSSSNLDGERASSMHLHKGLQGGFGDDMQEVEL